MKIGGSISTNYNVNKTVDDTTSIKPDRISYITYEMLILKVNLNNSLSPEDKNRQETLHFVNMDDNKTKIIATMAGWGHGSHWNKTYCFFEKENDWTYKEILKLF